VPTSDWNVDVASVGSLLRARTRDTEGNEVGTFNDDTRPDEEQVLELITSSLSSLASAIGSDILSSFWVQAGTVASYKVAMLIELSFFPEMVSQGSSPYDQIRGLYSEALADLKRAIAGELPGESSSSSAPPSYGFPVTNTLDTLLGPPPGTYNVPPNLRGTYP
jgi:hypothetical protein